MPRERMLFFPQVPEDGPRRSPDLFSEISLSHAHRPRQQKRPLRRASAVSNSRGITQAVGS